MAEQQFKNVDVYALILRPESKLPKQSADPVAFARRVQQELEGIQEALASQDPLIEIDGKLVDKTSSAGQLLINDKLSELEALNNQNFNLLQIIRRTEDSLRQIA
ncbi:MAG: hypothetical protein KDC92_17790 [Bacteroidetes bacterium]|nr:hypothetical protein [Bacteroidota bacterium]